MQFPFTDELRVFHYRHDKVLLRFQPWLVLSPTTFCNVIITNPPNKKKARTLSAPLYSFVYSWLTSAVFIKTPIKPSFFFILTPKLHSRLSILFPRLVIICPRLPIMFSRLAIICPRLPKMFSGLSIIYPRILIMFSRLTIICPRLLIMFSRLSIIYPRLLILLTRLPIFRILRKVLTQKQLDKME